MIRDQKEIWMQVTSNFRDFAVAAELAHPLHPGIHSGNAKIFSISFIGELCGQRAWRKDAGKQRNKIKAL